MKKLVILRKIIVRHIILAMAVIGYSQITIDSSDLGVPNTYILYAIGDSSKPFPPNPSGNNVIWDFSSFPIIRFDTMFFHKPSDFPQYAIPGTNWLTRFPWHIPFGSPSNKMDIQLTHYELTNTDGLIEKGLLTIIAGYAYNISYKKPLKILNFPASLSYSFSDSGRIDTILPIQSQMVDSFRIVRVIKTRDTIDANGYIYLPADTYQAVRLFSIRAVKDSLWVHFTGSNQYILYQVSHDTFYNFSWLSDSMKFLIANLELMKDDTVPTLYQSRIIFQIRNLTAKPLIIPSCNNPCGNILYGIAGGGVPPYVYTWSNGSTTTTADTLKNTCPGSYYLTVSDAANKYTYATINVYGPLSINSTVTDVSSSGSSDGSIITSVSGGYPPYLFLWSNGQTTQNLTGISKGTYYLTVVDQMGCSLTDTFVVVVAGINELSHHSNIRYYYTPDGLFIESPYEILDIKIFDIFGRSVYTYTIPFYEKQKKLYIKLSQKGFYTVILNILTGQGSQLEIIKVIMI